MSFIEKTYTDGYGEIMVHQDVETGKYLRVYVYTQDLPDLSWLWDKEEWQYINNGRTIKGRAFSFKTKLSSNPLFTHFLLTQSRSIERLINELEDADYICMEDENAA